MIGSALVRERTAHESRVVRSILLISVVDALGTGLFLAAGLLATHLMAGARVRRMAQVRVARNAGFCGGSLIAALVMLTTSGLAAVVVGLVDGPTFVVSAAVLTSIPPWAPVLEDTGDLRRVFDRAGFDWVSSHTLRKTVATRLDDAGLTARQIADHLGHARPSLTQDVYWAAKSWPRGPPKCSTSGDEKWS